jgi:methylamine dehydrogenase accessory protein MauD
MTALVVSVVVLWVLVLLLSIIVILLYRQFGLLYIGSGRRIRMTGLAVGKHAPNGLNLTVEGQDRELSWATAEAGRGTVLIFGGPLCPLCETLVQELDEAVRALGHLVDFIFVDRHSAHDEDHEPRALPETRLWQYAVSENGAAHDAFDVVASPYAFLIDANGIVVAKDIVNSADGLAALVETASKNGRIAFQMQSA